LPPWWRGARGTRHGGSWGERVGVRGGFGKPEPFAGLRLGVQRSP